MLFILFASHFKFGFIYHFEVLYLQFLYFEIASLAIGIICFIFFLIAASSLSAFEAPESAAFSSIGCACCI